MLGKTYQAQKSAARYRVKMTTQRYGSNKKVITEEIACPDRKHITMASNGKVLLDIYEIGSTQYLKSKLGWTKAPDPPAPFQITKRPTSGCPGGSDDYLGGEFNLGVTLGEIIHGKIAGKADISKGSSTTLNGIPCETWDIAKRNLLNEPESIEMCIATSDSLPLRIAIDEPEGTTEVIYSDWNSGRVTVKAPATYR